MYATYAMYALTMLTALLIAPSICVAQTRDISGSVFVDSNHNGVFDRGERGVAQVVVSNQDAVVTTDASGSYRLSRGTTGVMFISVPDGYQATRTFWRSVSDTTTTLDFSVSPVRQTTTFTFIHASDTHIAQAVLSRTQRFRALADSLNPAFVIITGDLVRDALRVGEPEATGYYELFGREAALFKNPVWTIPGNHENFGIERDKSKVAVAHSLYGRKMYRHYRGPDYYSFNYGGVHFVGLNSVDIDDKWYYGHVDSAQIAWLERDLTMVPPAMPVVTFNHIPFFSSSEILAGYTDEGLAPTLITVNGKTTFRHTVSNAREVLALLRKHRHVLALGGHIHAGEHIEYEADNIRTMFNQAPAIVGPRTSAGVQFPSGFTLYTVRDGVLDGGRFLLLATDPPQ
jgi:predicted MPP superfamily phosphohydrolase